jgi:hypothetical protein
MKAGGRVTVFKGSVEICEICFGDWGLWLEEENRKQKTEFRSQNLGVANWNIDFEPVGVPSETLIKPKSCRHSEPAIHFGDSDSCFLFSVSVPTSICSLKLSHFFHSCFDQSWAIGGGRSEAEEGKGRFLEEVVQ